AAPGAAQQRGRAARGRALSGVRGWRFSQVYMPRHRALLLGLEGDPLSETWVTTLARKIGAATATPGYRLYQRGIALDFRNPQPGVRNEKPNTAMARWRDTWFYDWLVAHAPLCALFDPASGSWYQDEALAVKVSDPRQLDDTRTPCEGG